MPNKYLNKGFAYGFLVGVFLAGIGFYMEYGGGDLQLLMIPYVVLNGVPFLVLTLLFGNGLSNSTAELFIGTTASLAWLSCFGSFFRLHILNHSEPGKRRFWYTLLGLFLFVLVSFGAALFAIGASYGGD